MGVGGWRICNGVRAEDDWVVCLRIHVVFSPDGFFFASWCFTS